MDIRHEPDQKRFALDTEHGTARLEYIPSPGLITYTHTEVPVGAEGQGIGAALARAGLEYAKAEGLTVMPLCPFVSAYIRRHPEWRPIVLPGFHL
ncbi:MAG: GNAT family N-acetyltransferase [Bacteroidota bacterium]